MFQFLNFAPNPRRLYVILTSRTSKYIFLERSCLCLPSGKIVVANRKRLAAKPTFSRMLCSSQSNVGFLEKIILKIAARMILKLHRASFVIISSQCSCKRYIIPVCCQRTGIEGGSMVTENGCNLFYRNYSETNCMTIGRYDDTNITQFRLLVIIAKVTVKL